MRERKLVIILKAVVLGAICVISPLAHADAQVQVINTTVSVTGQTEAVPCANGGAGENVILSGNLHWLLRTIVTANGSVHISYYSQSEGVTGLGQTTGDEYQAVGVTQQELTGTVGGVITTLNNVRFIGQGNGVNFLIEEISQIVVNANGTITANVYIDNVDCR